MADNQNKIGFIFNLKRFQYHYFQTLIYTTCHSQSSNCFPSTTWAPLLKNEETKTKNPKLKELPQPYCQHPLQQTGQDKKNIKNIIT